jgi:hypothetical protein
MTIGSAELWADVYVEEALHIGDWGSWLGFMGKLSATFKDEEESRRNLEAMATLRQGKGSATDYFIQIE